MPFGWARTSSTWPSCGTRRYPVSACNGLPSATASSSGHKPETVCPHGRTRLLRGTRRAGSSGTLPAPWPAQRAEQRRQLLEIRVQVGFRHASPSARVGDIAVCAQRLDLALEIVCRREGSVHRRESQVGDLVKITQRPKDGQADLVTRNLRRPGGTHGVFDLLGQADSAHPRRPGGPGTRGGHP